MVSGELYEVDDLMFEVLDYLEGHPSFYTREKIHVLPENDPLSPIECWAYLKKDFNPQLLEKGEMLTSYDSAQTY